MSPYRNRLKTPEEIELDKKREELTQLQQELVNLEHVFLNLKAEIRAFEQRYESVLGGRINELEDLEWQLKGFHEHAKPEKAAEFRDTEEAFNQFHSVTDLLDEEDAQPADERRKSLKELYREVAKAVHPDLATDDEDRLRRQELMSFANQAYATGNRSALEDILSDLELAPAPEEQENVALELVRVIRQIARVRQNIHAQQLRIEELRSTDIYQFKLKVDDAEVDGINLMAEMAATVDLDIAKTKRRLAALRGEEDTQDELKFAETRIIRFPVDRFCGMLFERNRGSVDYREWKRLGRAQGAREVFLDKAIRLDVHGNGETDIGFLEQMQPGDFQALFMYDVDDSALQYLHHLSGLEELYLSNTTISDNGLCQLAKLDGLKRLYIYHTAISDQGLDNLANLKRLKWLTCSGTIITEAGLNSFRQKLPGCKAVSFEWRHGKQQI